MPARKVPEPVIMHERPHMQTVVCNKGHHIVTTNYGFHKEFPGKSFLLNVDDLLSTDLDGKWEEMNKEIIHFIPRHYDKLYQSIANQRDIRVTDVAEHMGVSKEIAHHLIMILKKHAALASYYNGMYRKIVRFETWLSDRFTGLNKASQTGTDEQIKKWDEDTKKINKEKKSDLVYDKNKKSKKKNFLQVALEREKQIEKEEKENQ